MTAEVPGPVVAAHRYRAVAILEAAGLVVRFVPPGQSDEGSALATVGSVVRPSGRTAACDAGLRRREHPERVGLPRPSWSAGWNACSTGSRPPLFASISAGNWSPKCRGPLRPATTGRRPAGHTSRLGPALPSAPTAWRAGCAGAGLREHKGLPGWPFLLNDGTGLGAGAFRERFGRPAGPFCFWLGGGGASLLEISGVPGRAVARRPSPFTPGPGACRPLSVGSDRMTIL